MRPHRITTIGLISLLAVTLATPAAAATRHADERPIDFGKQWVRSHPFTLMGLTVQTMAMEDDKYANVGFNTMLAWEGRDGIFAGAVRMGLPYHFRTHTNRTLDDVVKKYVRRMIETYPGAEAILTWDEPVRPELVEGAKILDWVREQWPNLLCYSNAYPYDGMPGRFYGAKWTGPGTYEAPPHPYTYDDYLDDFAQILRPDVLMVDPYPYEEPPEGTDTEYLQQNFFQCLASARGTAKRAGIPYWTFVQSFSYKGYRRRPSESDLRMQVYASLAYGFTGIAYFLFDHGYDAGLLKGKKEQAVTPLYHHATKLNREVAHLGRTLRFLTSTAVRHVPGRFDEIDPQAINSTPAGLRVYARQETIGRLRDIRVEGTGRDYNALIGFFRDDDDGEYFVLVNLRRGRDKRADDVPLKVTLTFEQSATKLGQLSRQTGEPELIAVPLKPWPDHLHLPHAKDAVVPRLTIVLPGGTGELFKLDDHEFPGLNEAMPNPE